jgi:hypothetical protein
MESEVSISIDNTSNLTLPDTGKVVVRRCVRVYPGIDLDYELSADLTRIPAEYHMTCISALQAVL